MAKELMRLTYETLVDKRHALGLLEKVKREGDALIYSENKLNREKTEFNKHLHEESFKTKERLEKIHSLEKIYERKKVELVDIHKQIELAKMRSENLKKESRTPEVLENYRPYEELISEVLEKLPQCKNVFDIISNVVNLNTTVKLDSELFKTDDDTYENLEASFDEVGFRPVWFAPRKRKVESIWERVQDDFMKRHRGHSYKHLEDSDIKQIIKHLKKDEESQNIVASESEELDHLILNTKENYGYQSESGGEWFSEDYEEGYKSNLGNRINFQWSRSLLEEDSYPENTLTVQEASKCLSRIGQVGNGLCYAYIQINLTHRNLTNIEEITHFKYLSLIDLSYNHLDLISLDVLRDLVHVVFVQADHNVVNSLCLTSLPYLQVLTLNSNKVTTLSGLQQPSLECLELNDNKITRVIQEPSKSFNSNYCNEIDCPNLVTLALSRNVLETKVFEQLTFVSITLRVLYLSYNKIESLLGLDSLLNLCRLNLRANCISTLDGITDNLKQLSYLNLRENHLADTNELAKLACLGSLKTLIVSQNRFDPRSTANLRPYLTKLVPCLERIDKQKVVRNASDDNSENIEWPDVSQEVEENE
ncbi:Leucine-rich repeat,Leucine-rich repeat domain, L domain-like [Cinara cedri]|uniref:Leucine-rich repeat,Leucine-rich repeat domain, L domain-like n=1 Tax=Cinara cedri TaxID=506608 RepID=A0A5E4MX50_9HEMI|nr:Leucine-rich repeat,Leucine-rich repeat domain, L domain-like [Cinara cedri]